MMMMTMILLLLLMMHLVIRGRQVYMMRSRRGPSSRPITRDHQYFKSPSAVVLFISIISIPAILVMSSDAEYIGGNNRKSMLSMQVVGFAFGKVSTVSYIFSAIQV